MRQCVIFMGVILSVSSKSNICDAGKSKTLQQNRISLTAFISLWLSEIILGSNVRKKVPCQIFNYCLIINFLANRFTTSSFTSGQISLTLMYLKMTFISSKPLHAFYYFFLWKQMQIQNWILFSTFSCQFCLQQPFSQR